MRHLLVPLVAASLLASAAVGQEDSSKVSASGGGVVKEGADLTLTYNVGKVWDRCYWFWYQDNGDRHFCNFDLDPATGSAELHRCDPEELKNALEYTGTDKTKCEITLKEVTPEENGKWAARVDELSEAEIRVVVAQPVKSAAISLGEVGEDGADVPVVAGKNGTVRCAIHGGKPAPAISLEIADMDKKKIIDDSQSQKPNEEGVYETEQVFIIRAGPEDHGREVKCKALILDGDAKVLFDPVEAETKSLQVNFPPQPMEDQIAKGTEEGEAEVSFVFKSNPAPSKIRWVISQPENDKEDEKEGQNGGDQEQAGDAPAQSRQGAAEGEEQQDGGEGDGEGEKSGDVTDPSDKDMVLSPGRDDDKYTVSELKDEGDMKYRATLKIKRLDKADEAYRYKLQAINDVGSQDYSFTVAVDKKEEDGDDGNDDGGEDGSDGDDDDNSDDGEDDGKDDEDEDGGSKSTVVFFILAVVCVVGIVLGSIFVYKKKKANTETAPLRN